MSIFFTAGGGGAGGHFYRFERFELGNVIAQSERQTV